MIATRVACGAPAPVSVIEVPGSSSGYCATPHPQITAATPSAAGTRMPRGRDAVSRPRTARPHSPAMITSASARPVRRLNKAGFEICSSARVASDSAPVMMAAAWARRVK